jgi:hypothetical protein
LSLYDNPRKKQSLKSGWATRLKEIEFTEKSYRHFEMVIIEE